MALTDVGKAAPCRGHSAVRLLQIGGAIGFAALLLTPLPSSTRNLTRLPDTSQSLPHEPAETPGALAARP